MKKSSPLSVEFVYQLFTLIVIVIAVHAVYIAVIRPRGDAFLAEQAALMAQDPKYVSKRSVYVVVYDYEQEACFILMLWAVAIMAYKAITTIRHRRLLNLDLIPLAEGVQILPEDTRDLSRRIQALPADQCNSLLPRALLAALQRFSSTRNVQGDDAGRLDSELSMIRYIAWAIPSVGFLGTVRGIGDALGQAHKALEGDIFGVTRSLGVAFNSTLKAS